MKLKSFEIVLTDPEAVYFSGQIIQGHVILELEKDTKVRGKIESYTFTLLIH